jgi:hypothetical protein
MLLARCLHLVAPRWCAEKHTASIMGGRKRKAAAPQAATEPAGEFFFGKRSHRWPGRRCTATATAGAAKPKKAAGKAQAEDTGQQQQQQQQQQQYYLVKSEPGEHWPAERERRRGLPARRVPSMSHAGRCHETTPTTHHGCWLDCCR